MNSKLLFYLNDFERIKEEEIKAIIQNIYSGINFEFPKDYLEIIKYYDGSEGEVGNSSYLILFPLKKLLETNNNYKFLLQEIPDYFLFGKDAADTGYAFHKTRHTYHSFGLMSDFKTDFIDFYGNNFLEFLEFLYNK